MPRLCPFTSSLTGLFWFRQFRHTKRRLCFFLPVFFALLTNVCAAPEQPTRIPALPQRVVIVGEKGNMPNQYHNPDGEAVGIYVDYWKLWGKKAGLDVDVVLVEWTEALEMVQRGEADAVSAILYTPERDEWLDYSIPIKESEFHIFFRKEIGALSDVSDIRNLRVGVVRGDAVGARLLERLPDQNVVREFGTYQSVIEAAARREIDVFIESTSTAFYYLSQLGQSEEFRYTPKPLFSQEIHAAVLEGNHEVLRLLNKGIGAISQQEFDALQERWLGVQIQKETILTYLLAVLGIVVVIAGVVFIWDRDLRRRVRNATSELMRVNESLEAEMGHRQQVQQQLQANEQQLETIVNSITDPIVALDAEYRITRLNQAAERMLQQTGLEVRNQNWLTISRQWKSVGSQSTNEVSTVLEQSRLQKKCILSDNPIRIQPVNADSYCYYMFSAAPTFDQFDQLQGFVVVLRDVSEIHLMQDRLRQSEKMEAIGQLAGGVAHDFNNMLTGIIGLGELLSFELEGRADLQNYVEQIMQTAEKASDLTSKLLTFSRKGETRRKPLDLHEPVEAAISILRRSIDRRITIQTNLSAEDHHVLGDWSQLENAVLNLGTNARDAMLEGGCLTISTRNENIPAEPGSDLPCGRYVVVSVSDTGCGITPENQQRIFEPFFTTKEPGKGTGLGLAAVYGTVKEHDGNIELISTIGQGTCFEICLPVLQAPLEVALPETASHSHATVRGRILVVDDEVVVLDSMRSMLSKLGYEVFVAMDGQEALELFQGAQQPFDMVLLDVIMPRMDGWDCFSALRQLQAELPVVMCSGFLNETGLERMEEMGVNDFLQKPFRLQDLRLIVENALNHQQGFAYRKQNDETLS